MSCAQIPSSVSVHKVIVRVRSVAWAASLAQHGIIAVHGASAYRHHLEHLALDHHHHASSSSSVSTSAADAALAVFDLAGAPERFELELLPTEAEDGDGNGNGAAQREAWHRANAPPTDEFWAALEQSVSGKQVCDRQSVSPTALGIAGWAREPWVSQGNLNPV
jgi:hypothetical protein